MPKPSEPLEPGYIELTRYEQFYQAILDELKAMAHGRGGSQRVEIAQRLAKKLDEVLP